jgi:hypothetical protein
MNGKYSPKDRCRFFDIAHGSALECAAGLDVLVAKGKLAAEQIRPGKERLQRIVLFLIFLSLLLFLVRSRFVTFRQPVSRRLTRHQRLVAGLGRQTRPGLESEKRNPYYPATWPSGLFPEIPEEPNKRCLLC